MKKAKLVYGKSYIFGFFFWYEEFSHSTVIPLSFRFLTNSPHSPHLVSPHSPVIPLSFPSSFGFPSFPLIPLSFHCHLVSPHSPHSPGFPLIRFPLLHTQFSLGSLSLPLFSLDSLSPFPCSLKKQDNITDSRGKGQEG
jgi:hypothetical protein